jgi:hypothetical protein
MGMLVQEGGGCLSVFCCQGGVSLFSLLFILFLFLFFTQIYCARGIVPMLHITMAAR